MWSPIAFANTGWVSLCTIFFEALRLQPILALRVPLYSMHVHRFIAQGSVL